MPEVRSLLAPWHTGMAQILDLNSPEAETWIRIPTFCTNERNMRFSSLADSSCYIAGLYQEQCCHANTLVSPVHKKPEVIRTSSISSVLQNTVGLRLSVGIQLSPPIDFLIPTI